MLEKDITDKRKERHKKTQEDFTPVEICKILFEGQDELFSNFKKTFCDPCCGTGNIIRYLLRERLNYCKKSTDVYRALETIYGTELMEDNTEECQQKMLYDCLKWSSEHNIDLQDKKLISIIEHNIVCTNTFKWDYEEWQPYTEEELEIYKQLLMHSVGYKQAQDLYEAALRNYNPLEYAILKATKELETRDAIYNKKKSMS